MVPVKTGIPYFFRVIEIMCSSVDGNELEALGGDLDSLWGWCLSSTNWLGFTIFLTKPTPVTV